MKTRSLLASILVLGLSLLSTTNLLAQCGCTFNIGANTYDINGTSMGVKPGDVLCLPAGNIGNKYFHNINGTADKPVIIKNCGGKSYIEKPTTSSFGIDISLSRYFRLTGSGDAANFYGIEVKGSNQGIQIGGGASDFEIDHIKSTGTGYAGIAVKTNPSCDPATWRENYTMYNVKIHDNYVADTGGEGYYVGNSHYHFQVDKTCDGLPIKVWEHSIVNCEVYNNIAERTGRDGVQVGAVISGGAVYNNTVKIAGLLDPDHVNGVQINPGFRGLVYNNYVTSAAGWAIQSLGDGSTFFNNVGENCPLGGFFQDDRVTTPGVSFNIFNNTFIKNGRYGAYFLSVISTNNKFWNNIIVSDGSAGFKYTSKYPTASFDVQNNLQTTDINSVMFEDPASGNYKIKPGSPAIDAGKDVESYGVSYDYDKNPRPVNSKFDQGAYEVQGAVLTANAGPDKSIQLPTSTIVLSGSGFSPTGVTGYAWTKKSGGAATLTNANTATLTLTGLVQGTYVFQLQVNDAGGSAIDEVTVTVNPAATNQSPTANAGADKSIALPTNSITLIGSGTDLDGSIVSYLWTRLSGSGGTLANANTSTVTASGLTQGTYQFQLEVTDDKGATALDVVKVTVNAASTNVAPVVGAGTDKVLTLPTNTTVITGTATDADGTIASLLWEKRSGPAATLTNPTTLTLTASALVQGSYIFRLTATDDKGASAFDEVKVDVLPAANQSPTANAGTDKTITLPTNTTNITGSGTDPDGSIASYLWTQVSGPGAATITNGTTTTVTVSALAAGTYIFGLTVTDNSGATGYDEVKVTVNGAAANQTPTANAGTDKTITLPTNTLVLNGTGTDPDGTIASYSWTKKSGPTATLTNANTKDLSLSNLVAGAYVFTLRVTDNGTAFDDDDVSVTVLPAAVNLTPVVNAGGNKFLTLPTNSTTLNGIGSDPDGTIATFQWTQEQGPAAATLGGQATAALNVSGLIEGVYVFKLTVTDNAGATASDFATVVVSSGNLPPSVDAGPDQVIVLPIDNTTLNGSASDPEATAITYLWAQVSGPAFTPGPTNAASFNISNLVTGTYVFSLTATDADLASAVDEVTVTVLAASTNQLPVVTAGADQVVFLPTNSTVASGNATDADGTIASYLWTQTSGPAATFINETTSTVTVTGLAAGTYVLRLTATDNDGGSSFDEMKITVNPASLNQPPTANAGPNKIVQLPTNVTTLSGSGADNDGSVVSYTWTKISGPTATLTNANTATLTANNLLEGTYVFRLTVTDNEGATGFAEARVVVFPSTVNQPPIADAGQNQTLILPTNNTSLVGAGFDPDGTIATYGWTKVSGPASSVIVSPSNQVTAVNTLAQGVYVFRLTVTDNLGNTGFDDVTITVNTTATNIPPIADAGGGQTISLPTNSVILFGSGSDADGSIASYAWTKLSGGAASLANANTPTVTITGLAPGIYTFRLRVTDNLGATNDDVATVLVNDATANQPPVANAGPDKAITLPTNSINISGNGSDNDGTITSYLWEKTIGGAATLTNVSTTTLLASNLVEGLYVIRLTVADDDGFTDFDEMNLRVLPANSNIAPTVDAGLDTAIVLPTNSVVLKAIADDPDGTIATYFWTKVSGPPATLVDPNVANLDAQNLVEGTYIFQITVIDDKNTSSSDQVKVTVLPVGTNQPPVVNAGADITITLPTDATTVTATASDPEDGAAVTLLWTQTSGAAVAITPNNTLSFNLAGLLEGTYEFELTATDPDGSSSSDRVKVIVKPIPPNNPPIVDAGANVTVTLPSAATFDFLGSATDADGTGVMTYKWTQRSGPVTVIPATDTNPTLSVTNVVEEGLYVFRLTVTDDDGDAGFDDVLLVAANDPGTDRLPPLAYAGADTVIVLPENTIELPGNGADPDGFIESFVWTKVSGPNTPFETPGTSLKLIDAVEGQYEFMLTVTDNDSLSASDNVVILVTPHGEGIIIPKFLSPNNDTQNDTWAITNVEAIDGCLVTIFTREGRKVYETTSYDNTWAGNASNGQILRDGDYYYVIKCDGTILASGGVRIIR